MTIDEALSSLEMCKALMLFDALTGEAHNIEDENQDNQDLYHAIELSIIALTEKADRDNPQPLTLDELRKMDGQPVWVVYDDNSADWVLVSIGVTRCSTEDVFFIFNTGGSKRYIDIAHYVKCAYRYPPKEAQ